MVDHGGEPKIRRMVCHVWVWRRHPSQNRPWKKGIKPRSCHRYPPWPIFDNTRKELSSPCKIKIIHHLTVILEPYQLIEKDSFDIATKRCQYFPTRISYSIKKANNQHNITNSKLKNHTIAASHFNRGDVVWKAEVWCSPFFMLYGKLLIATMFDLEYLRPAWVRLALLTAYEKISMNDLYKLKYTFQKPKLLKTISTTDM